MSDPKVESLSERLGDILADVSRTSDWAEEGEDAPKNEGPLHESKYDVQVTLADQQADPNSPLYSVKSLAVQNSGACFATTAAKPAT